MVEVVSFGKASGPLPLHLCSLPLGFSVPITDINLHYVIEINKTIVSTIEI
jgi:hypothetical protein